MDAAHRERLAASRRRLRQIELQGKPEEPAEPKTREVKAIRFDLQTEMFG